MRNWNRQSFDHYDSPYPRRMRQHLYNNRPDMQGPNFRDESLYNSFAGPAPLHIHDAYGTNNTSYMGYSREGGYGPHTYFPEDGHPENSYHGQHIGQRPRGFHADRRIGRADLRPVNQYGLNGQYGNPQSMHRQNLPGHYQQSRGPERSGMNPDNWAGMENYGPGGNFQYQTYRMGDVRMPAHPMHRRPFPDQARWR